MNKVLNKSDFKIVKNKQKPDWCYEYVCYNEDKTTKYSIFTMNGGVNFLSSVTTKYHNKHNLTDYSNTFNNFVDALEGINNFLTNSKNK